MIYFAVTTRLGGTKNKGKLGANAILAVSMAVSKAGAAEKDVPLYKHIADLAGGAASARAAHTEGTCHWTVRSHRRHFVSQLVERRPC